MNACMMYTHTDKKRDRGDMLCLCADLLLRAFVRVYVPV